MTFDAAAYPGIGDHRSPSLSIQAIAKAMLAGFAGWRAPGLCLQPGERFEETPSREKDSSG
jgi:hypothetical protein